MMNTDVLVQPGCPAIYQKKTKKGNFGTVTRVTIGEKILNRPNKTILLVGETGAGKSTLVNALFNYAMGVKWEDKVWYKIVEEAKETSTSDVMVYEIFEYKTLPYSLTIIDTPGYKDTVGLKYDVIINQRLFDLFRSEERIHEVHAVGVVMKATENKKKNQLSYVSDSVMCLFGKDLDKNTVGLITHSDGTYSLGRGPLYLTFNNRQTEARTKETSSDLEEAWRLAENGMSQFSDFLQKISAEQLQVNVTFDSFIRSTASIHNMQERIRLTELKQREIKQIQEALKKHKQEIKMNKKFTIEVEEVYKVKEPLDGEKAFFKAAVCCTVCEENCHYPGCTIAPNPEKCEVMKSNSCTVCSKKCSDAKHVRVDWKYVTKTRKVQITKEECKKKYLKHITDTKKQEKFKETLAKKIESLNREKGRLIDKSYDLAVKLDPTLLKVNSVSTYINLDYLIKKIKERGDKEKLHALERIDAQMDGGAKSVIECKFDNTSLQYIKSNSVALKPGPPAVYQLKTRKITSGTVSRMTFGKNKQNKPNKTILLVGETGAGKSTLINAIVNYAMGVKFEDKVCFQIVEDENRNQVESQTSDVTVYEVFGFEGKTLPFSLTIIDTPGFGDTRGYDRDVIVCERLFDLFRSSDGIHKLDAVGLVLKSSVNRLSDRLKYIFNSVMSLFGKDIEKNIVALVTHSNGTKPKHVLKALEAADIRCAKDDKKQPVYFQFNNCQHEERTEPEYLENADRVASTGLSRFATFLGKTEPQKLGMTLEVLNERIRLSACIQNLEEKIKLSELKQKEIKQIQDALKNYDENMTKDDTVTVEYNETYKDKEDIEGEMWLMVLVKGAVCCTICEENCHYPGCSSSKSPEDCEVMKDGYCTVCTLKCPVSAHVKGKWRYVNKTKKVRKSLDEIRRRSIREQGLNFLGHLDKDMKKLRTEKSQLLNECYQHVNKLEKIALNVNSVSTFVDYDFLMEKLNEIGEANKIQKLEEMKNKGDERTRIKIKNVWGKVKSAGKKIQTVLQC